MKRSNTEEFKQKVTAMHGDEYTVLGEYVNNMVKIKMRHNLCGTEYDVLPSNVINGRRCPTCFGTPKKTTESFQKELNDKYGNEYIVLGKYVNNETKILVQHKCGNSFEIKPRHLNNRNRCPYCAGNVKKTNSEFLELIKDLNLTISDYKGMRTPVHCVCNVCGYEFDAYPNNLIRGHGCANCAGNAKHTVESLQEILGEEYEVLNLSNKTVTIKHKKCNDIYTTSLASVCAGSGCPKCASSKGEAIIRNYLDSKKIEYIEQYKFDDCRNQRTLPFDFYLPSFNMCIEYDGEGHFEAFRYKNAQKKLENTQRNDKIKDKYCDTHGIKLLRIPYFEKTNISKILDYELSNKEKAITEKGNV